MTEIKTTRRQLLQGAVLATAAIGVPAIAAAAPNPWAKFIAEHSMVARQLASVIPVAAKRGYLPDDISAISFVNTEHPEMAPALHFAQENGDVDIVMSSGVLVQYSTRPEDAAWNDLYGFMATVGEAGREVVRQARRAGFTPDQLEVVVARGAFADQGPRLIFKRAGGSLASVTAAGVS